MVVIVCGPDNVGKGTQIANIKKWLEETTKSPCHVLHYSNIKGLTGSENKHASVYLYKQMFEFLTFANKATESDSREMCLVNVICDRAHLGETVYSPMYRNRSGDFVWAIEYSYATKQTVKSGNILNTYSDDWKQTKLILFTDTYENLIEREDGYSFSIDPIKKQAELIAFDMAFNKSMLYKKKISITGLNANEVWEQQVLPFLKEKNEISPEGEKALN